jgi:hypothetical protein
MSHEQEIEFLTNELQNEPSVRMEDIRPSMTEEDRERTLAQIMRVLRGEE